MEILGLFIISQILSLSIRPVDCFDALGVWSRRGKIGRFQYVDFTSSVSLSTRRFRLLWLRSHMLLAT